MTMQTCDTSIDYRPQSVESLRHVSGRINDLVTLPHAGAQPAFWSGVFAMTLCVFALVASEFMPVSLLTPIAADLKISEGLA